MAKDKRRCGQRREIRASLGLYGRQIRSAYPGQPGPYPQPCRGGPGRWINVNHTDTRQRPGRQTRPAVPDGPYEQITRDAFHVLDGVHGISDELESFVDRTLKLFRMRYEVDQVINITSDLKIETPTSINTSLPDISAFIILFGS